MKVLLRTFGCRANHYDSEMVRAMLEEAGHVLVTSACDAEVAIFNSCAVTADAEADLRQAVRRAAREQAQLRTVVMGCAAAEPDSPRGRSLRMLPTVDTLVPGADLERLAKALALPPAVITRRAATQSGARALLRVQDGCDEHCTFCLTTIARGAQRSRSCAELVAEAALLAERHPEIVITGIHIGTYGTDIGSSLGELLERLVCDVPRVRFRLSSVEATEIDERMLALLASAGDRVAPHVHAPLQSGSNRILKRMGRHWYTASTYARAVERLASASRVLGLGADIITGFPGESDEDHRATVALVEALPFTYLHVFPYSMRPGTAAERLPGHIPAHVAQARARELRALGDAKASRYARSRIGGGADAIVVRSAGASKHGVGEALTEDYLTVLPGDPALPRMSRFDAVLEERQGRLVAVPHETEA
jgi:threonylcarbamoyladenosine tRNA methylthiotransferase MtaB